MKIHVVVEAYVDLMSDKMAVKILGVNAFSKEADAADFEAEVRQTEAERLNAGSAWIDRMSVEVDELVQE